MSNEEFERKMEFIIEQQAQFASDIQQLREVQAQTGQQLMQTGQHLMQLEQHVTQIEQLLTRLVNVTHEGFKDVNAKIDALVDSQIRLTHSHVRLSEAQERLSEAHVRLSESQGRLSEAHVRLSESQGRLTEAQSRTDEALRNLTVLVDRYFRDRSNGQA